MPVKKSKLAQNKTKATAGNVNAFINKVADEQKRKDSLTILGMMKQATGEKPRMWGSSIIGFGNLRSKSPATGREVDWFKIGFSPRKASISLYVSRDIKEYDAELKKLGKHKTGVCCLYINKLTDIDQKVLNEIITSSIKEK